MATKGHFVKHNFIDVGQIPERLLKMSQMEFHCVHRMNLDAFKKNWGQVYFMRNLFMLEAPAVLLLGYVCSSLLMHCILFELFLRQSVNV